MNWLIRLITPRSVTGICLAPFGIFIREDRINNQYLINHERIHWRQQWEMLIIPFYLWYLIEWLIKRIEHGAWVYNNLSFEREANHFEKTDGYLKDRPWYAWWKFI
ncbi:MAG TPA: hypothetical protein ENH82_10070 [bacterium]|nr:hypothetical protein [bacterium]